MGVSNSWAGNVLCWSWNEDVMLVFGLLQLNKFGISWGVCFNGLKGSGFVGDGLKMKDYYVSYE